MKFLRTYTLTVSLPDGNDIVIAYPLTIDINVVTNILASCNTAVINIYNLAESTRRRIFKDWIDAGVYMGVTLRAGYESGRQAIIFRGNVRSAYSVRNHTDWVTTIDAWDGGFAVENGYSSRTIPAGYTMQQAIKDIIKDMPNVAMGHVSTFDGATIGEERGASFMGPAWEAIKDINKDGINFINDEKIYCLMADEYLDDLEPVEINAETGLLGTPERQQSLVKVRTLFEPNLSIGRMANLLCAEKVFNGAYRVNGIHHNGTISGTQGGQLTTTIDLATGNSTLPGSQL